MAIAAPGWWPELRAEQRAVLAVARARLRQVARYKINTLSVILIQLYQFLVPSLLLSATFLVGGRASGFQRSAGTGDVAGFLFLGAVAGTFAFGAFWGVGYQIRMEMQQGTLESLWLAPIRRHVIVLGYALADLVVSSVSGALLLLIGGVVFGAHYLLALAAALPALLLGTVALAGVAYLVASLALVVRDPNFLVDALSYLFAMGSGAAFPLGALSGVLAVVPLAIPTTYVLDILRTDALGTRPLLPQGEEYALLGLITLILVPLGAGAFALAERRMRRRGTVGTY